MIFLLVGRGSHGSLDFDVKSTWCEIRDGDGHDACQDQPEVREYP